MSMQLKIVHTTGFEYDGKANTSFNEARLTPLTLPGQIVVHSRIEVTPTPWAYTYRDYWGSQVTAFEVLDPHQSLTITANATVQVDRRPVDGPVLSWEQLRSDEVSDPLTEFLTLPERVEPTEDLAALARDIADGSETPTEAAREVCALVNREVKYVSGSTAVDAHAGHSWTERSGVCQDMAHIAIGALRSVGIPARYVSGYLHPRREPVIGETVSGESHAWIEWWDDGWRGSDPTNATEPGDRHVIVATGRDYGDVKPLSGIFSGSGTSRMFVDVQVTRLH
jgi:transglutaminase-like putative cysteine protease